MSEKSDVALVGELEAIARAAADRLRAQADDDPGREVELGQTVGEAAGRAIGAVLSLAEIADAERIGQRRARDELGAKVLRRVERAARRKREADSEYEQAIVRAGRLGLAHRDVAAAAGVAHGTLRAILARTQAARDADRDTGEERSWTGVVVVGCLAVARRRDRTRPSCCGELVTGKQRRGVGGGSPRPRRALDGSWSPGGKAAMRWGAFE